MFSEKTKVVLRIIPLIFFSLFAVLLLAPIISMFGNMDQGSITEILSEGSFGILVRNSVQVSFLATFISMVLAYVFVWCVERTNMPCKNILKSIIIAPMLVPSVSIGMGVVRLCGNNGILTNTLGVGGSEIYGFPGIVWGSVLYSLPVAYIMIENILKYEDSSPYEAAKVLGISPLKQFFAITLPYLKKPIIAVAFSVFTLSFTDYGVPLMVGGKFKTLSAVMYQEVIGQLDFGKGCVYGSTLLIPAVAAFVVDLASKNNSNSTYVIKSFEIERNLKKDIPAFIYSFAIAIFSVLPIAAFVALAFLKKYPSDMSFTFYNFYKTFQRGGAEYLINSVLIALLTAAAGVLIAVATAYLTARMKNTYNRLLHLIAMSTAAIPGIVLGLSYVLFFNESFIYGTVIIIIMVNTMHFFASPYLMIYTSFSKANENLESVAETLGIGKMALLKDVLVPKCKHTILEMFSYYFVNCMMTISAVSFLANINTRPISLMINQFEAQGQIEFAATTAFMILIINVMMKIFIRFVDTKT